MAEPAYAVVDILCDLARLNDLQAIPNLRAEILVQTDDPQVALVHAFADADAQDAARALGCTVTVLQSAEDYQKRVDAAYEAIGDDGGGTV